MVDMGLRTVTTECRHWERIEMPDGPVCIGKCKKCGREKEYPTTKWPDYNNEPLNRKREWPDDG